jgi:putative pyrroloquinoline-quinone binding quinoprotein
MPGPNDPWPMPPMPGPNSPWPRASAPVAPARSWGGDVNWGGPLVIMGIVLWGLISLLFKGPPEDAAQFDSSSLPRLADVNGDGVLDTVGWVNLMERTELKARLAAFDGADGRRLWITPSSIDLPEHARTLFEIVGPVLITVDGAGRAQALRAADGTPAWWLDLSERAMAICRGEPGQAIFMLADRTALAVDLFTSVTEPSALPSSCATDASRPWPSSDWLRTRPWFDKKSAGEPGSGEGDAPEGQAAEPPKVVGMYIDGTLPAGAGGRVLIGHKEPGTSVPMVGVWREGRAAWSGVVPREGALGAAEGAPTAVAADAETVVAVYQPVAFKDVWRVAAFAAADGQRLWDIGLPNAEEGNVGFVHIVQDRVLVAHWTYLDVFDRRSGQLRYTVGRWR